ncbi:hypothetical protein [uncultured Sphingomonas sp.]|uniref:hypothetical protein n=1 Tax=uncultured Sphingomonas sp. TaxID=158754 RepID=UPI0035CB0C41
MRVLRVAAGAVLAMYASGAAPLSAQFYLQSKPLAGQPVKGDEPGIIGSPLPGATPDELRAGLVWTMRAALNVAALQCQFEPTLGTVRNYNALLVDHRDELKNSFDVLTKYFVRTGKTKKEGQTALDQFGTRIYSSYATVGAQRGFCQTANTIGTDANFTPRGHFFELAEARMQEVRNSLVPFGEQRFPRNDWREIAVVRPRLDAMCWNKKGEWRANKCGVSSWPATSPTGLAVDVASR